MSVVERFQDMAELDRVRHAPNPPAQAALEQLAALSRAPLRMELYRVLVAFPA